MGDAATNDATIVRFYTAFAAHDGATMAACYAPAATFSDPVFRGLKDGEPGAMWRMLTGRASDLKIELAEHSADDTAGTAHWIATYTFETGRKVVNDIQATFRFTDDGLIAEHVDEFDLYKWARQALGLPGLLLGWSPPLRNTIRGKARKSLDEFLAQDKAA